VSDPQDAKRIEQLQERIDEVEEEIEEARADAEKVFPHEKESFAQTGSITTETADDRETKPKKGRDS
jgi:carbonic anhydrase